MVNMYVATEDAVSEAVTNVLVSTLCPNLVIGVRMGRRGFGYLKNKLPDLMRLPPQYPVLVVTDLDTTPCVPMLLSQWGYSPKATCLLRVAVREIEAWLLADHPAMHTTFGIPLNRLPVDPDSLADPKRELLSLLRRYADRETKQEMLPLKNSKAQYGYGFIARLCIFARNHWSPQRAATRSMSLQRCITRIIELDRIFDTTV